MEIVLRIEDPVTQDNEWVMQHNGKEVENWKVQDSQVNSRPMYYRLLKGVQ